MFDLSWAELLFVAALALIVIGPKELPALVRSAGKMAARVKRTVADVKGSLNQLEREVDMASGKTALQDNWQEHLPRELRELPADFVPGSMTPEQHRSRREQIDEESPPPTACEETDSDKRMQHHVR